jgi:hypothetical protein
MDPSNAPLKRLILGVIQLCDRTCDLAESEAFGPFAMEPLRDSIDALLRAVEDVEQSAPGSAGFPMEADELRRRWARD